MSDKNPSTNVTIYSRITLKERNKINALVKAGDYMSMSDFIRQAIRAKLGET